MTFFGLLSFADSYDQLFPYYVEYCSATKLQTLDGQGDGGPFGHSVLYIKGLCRDKTAGYPKVFPCPDGSTSISVDGGFSNVMWMALDGREDLLTGNIPADATIDQAQVKRTESAMIGKGYFKGIKLKKEIMATKPSNQTDDEFIADNLLATDFAINFGRNVYCAKLPIKQEMIPVMADYLNSKNDEYYKTGKEYQWSVVWDNCAHLAYNVLAAVGILPYKSLELLKNRITGQEKPEDVGKPLSLFPMAMPGRRFIEFISLGNEESLKVEDVYADPFARQMFESTYHWVATQPGALFVYYPIRPLPFNKMFKTENSIPEAVWMPGGPQVRWLAHELHTQARFTDLHANLLAFEKEYSQSLQHFKNFAGPGFGNLEFSKFYLSYGDYLNHQLADVKAKLQWLDGNDFPRNH